MDHAEFLKTLQLPPAASRHDIQRAFRKMAIELHPDRYRGDPRTHHQFIEMSKAYRAAMRAMPNVKRGEQSGICVECRGFAELYRGLDGRMLCENCLVRSMSRRYLPLPGLIVVVKCLPAIVLNLAALVLLLLGMTTGSVWISAAAMAAGLLSLATLAVTCLYFRYCADEKTMQLQQRLEENRNIRITSKIADE